MIREMFIVIYQQLGPTCEACGCPRPSESQLLTPSPAVHVTREGAGGGGGGGPHLRTADSPSV